MTLFVFESIMASASLTIGGTFGNLSVFVKLFDYGLLALIIILAAKKIKPSWGLTLCVVFIGHLGDDLTTYWILKNSLGVEQNALVRNAIVKNGLVKGLILSHFDPLYLQAVAVIIFLCISLYYLMMRDEKFAKYGVRAGLIVIGLIGLMATINNLSFF